MFQLMATVNRANIQNNFEVTTVAGISAFIAL